MSRNASPHYGPDNSGSFPSATEISQSISVPDGWDVELKRSGGEIAGYSIIASLKHSDQKQGVLISDREYRRVAVILYPIDDSFQKYVIKASEVTADTTVADDLEPLTEKIQNRHENLQDHF